MRRQGARAFVCICAFVRIQIQQPPVRTVNCTTAIRRGYYAAWVLWYVPAACGCELMDETLHTGRPCCHFRGVPLGQREVDSFCCIIPVIRYDVIHYDIVLVSLSSIDLYAVGGSRH